MLRGPAVHPDEFGLARAAMLEIHSQIRKMISATRDRHITPPALGDSYLGRRPNGSVGAARC